MIEDITLFKQYYNGKGYRLVKRKNENEKNRKLLHRYRFNYLYVI
jgi:hypothetical protein